MQHMCRKNAAMDPTGNRKLPAHNCAAGAPLFGTGSTRPRASRLSSTHKAVAENLDRFTAAVTQGGAQCGRSGRLRCHQLVQRPPHRVGAEGLPRRTRLGAARQPALLPGLRLRHGGGGRAGNDQGSDD